MLPATLWNSGIATHGDGVVELGRQYLRCPSLSARPTTTVTLWNSEETVQRRCGRKRQPVNDGPLNDRVPRVSCK